MLRHSFHAMGTEVELLLDAAEDGRAFEAVEAEFERLEAALSRFRPESELSRLNETGQATVGEDLFRVAELALQAREETSGRFDPTVHNSLVAAGYDRTFEEVGVRADQPGTAPCAGKVLLDRSTRTVHLEDGSRLDFGGIGKGYAVERAAELLCRQGPCLVNAGGDLAVRGRPGGTPWTVGVETASGSITLGLEHGAIATSGSDRRRWIRAGREQHHLIDPATGKPAESDLVRATVVCDSATDAEVFAKVLFLAGERDAVAEARRRGIAGVLITPDGRTVLTGGLG